MNVGDQMSSEIPMIENNTMRDFLDRYLHYLPFLKFDKERLPHKPVVTWINVL